MKRYRTKEYEIIDSRGNVSGETIGLARKSYLRNRRFFGRGTGFFRIYVEHDEEGFRKRAGKCYNPWTKAAAREGKIIAMRNLELLRKTFKKYGGTQDFGVVLTHEINHLYAKRANLFRGPFWMIEGLATYVAGQVPGKTYTTEADISQKRALELMFYRQIIRKACPEMYILHYKAMDFLINKFGRKGLFELFGTYFPGMKKADFKKNFRRIMGMEYDDFLVQFVSRRFA